MAPRVWHISGANTGLGRELALKALKGGDNDQGTIVNLSSIGALHGYPSNGVYCATKVALEGITQAFAARMWEYVAGEGLFKGKQRWLRLPLGSDTGKQMRALSDELAEMVKDYEEIWCSTDFQE
ncbi:uncharacterized protein B0T15DRAFT_492695 [Chaetomium strumarium]|uniref:Uncharacterized protein n=1 Tax=Chaetomium strumarium TaxID=1170767 RepID=A0AAJ0M314_9PEZI|nr:hypothetical protein B0T15DRAFT_492695 [Chaetomium strumarium]